MKGRRHLPTVDPVTPTNVGNLLAVHPFRARQHDARRNANA
jgi:hypothetical protein